jgi:hypothetical protein
MDTNPRNATMEDVRVLDQILRERGQGISSLRDISVCFKMLAKFPFKVLLS